ncbi:hypothetical protein EXIGLDRAFT_749849 [Exidia glandulosa HHB12029]|uniref:MYND-type domain-containing protein n=1 Tax=Exidia glandulosa HHB12029 TaxID=1314781 RepID=A0A166AHX5_EXIGL|nr:hypothetical protein EXIGLDRAFT_749849 [Exidia glandulosa HHB12029]
MPRTAQPSNTDGRSSGSSPTAFTRIERQAHAFTRQFQASICLKCHLDWMLEVDRLKRLGMDNDALYHLRSTCPDFCVALMRFLTAHRPVTVENRIALSNALCRTRCRRCSATSNPARSSSPQLFDTVFNYWCNFAAAALYAGTGDASRRRAFGSKGGLWPSTPEQLLPLGVAATVDSLVSAMDVFPNVLLVLAMVLRQYRSLVFQEIMLQHHRQKLVHGTIVSLRRAYEDVIPQLNRHRLTVSGTKYSDAKGYDKAVVGLLQPYEPYVRILDAVVNGIDGRGPDLESFVISHEVDLYRAIVKLLGCFHDAFTWFRCLPDIAISMYVNLDAEDRLDPPEFIRTRVRQFADVYDDPYLALLSLLPALSKRRHCYGPRCGKHVHETGTKKPFSWCAQCKMVQYCSKECQRDDWKYSQYSHREMCELLCSLFSFANLQMDGKTFSEMCRAHNFSVDSADRLTEWISGSYEPRTMPAFYQEILTGSIGQRRLPQSVWECRDFDDFIYIVEQAAGTKAVPGAYIVADEGMSVEESRETERILKRMHDISQSPNFVPGDFSWRTDELLDELFPMRRVDLLRVLPMHDDGDEAPSQYSFEDSRRIRVLV